MRDQIDIVAGYACALYTDLVTNGAPIQFSDVLFHKDGVKPSNPEFFWNFEALGELFTWANDLATKPRPYFAGCAK